MTAKVRTKRNTVTHYRPVTDWAIREAEYERTRALFDRAPSYPPSAKLLAKADALLADAKRLRGTAREKMAARAEKFYVKAADRASNIYDAEREADKAALLKFVFAALNRARGGLLTTEARLRLLATAKRCLGSKWRRRR